MGTWEAILFLVISLLVYALIYNTVEAIKEVKLAKYNVSNSKK